MTMSRASAEKFLGRGRETEKTRPKNSTIKPRSALSVSCMKIQGGRSLPCPLYRRPWIMWQPTIIHHTKNTHIAIKNS